MLHLLTSRRVDRTNVPARAGLSSSRPEPLYFWFYFVCVNSIWVVIPALVLWRAACQVTRAAAATEAMCALPPCYGLSLHSAPCTA